MNSQVELAQAFHALHVSENPLVLINVWDAGSAKVVAAAGAQAIGTSSWSVSASHGAEDGELLALELAIANLKRIVTSVELPVSVDIEAGYGTSPTEIEATMEMVISSGAVGINIEDGVVGSRNLYSIAEQSARIKALRQTAEEFGVPIFTNARADVYLNSDAGSHNALHLEEALCRAEAYCDAGASGFFVPGLQDTEQMARLCESCSLPVNVVVSGDTLSKGQFGQIGVSRISYGPAPYQFVMKSLEGMANASLKGADATIQGDVT